MRGGGKSAHRPGDRLPFLTGVAQIYLFFPTLTDGIFETGAYGVPSKSQNPTVLGQGGPSSTQCSNPN